MALTCNFKAGGSYSDKVMVFAETASGYFGASITGTTSTSVSSTATTGTGLVAAAVPTVANYYVSSWSINGTASKVNSSNAVYKWTASNYGTASYPLSVSTTSSGSSVTVKDDHGTHQGTPTGTNMKFYNNAGLGVRHTSTDSGWTFNGWKVTFSSTSSSAGTMLSKGYTSGTGGVYTFGSSYDSNYAVVLMTGSSSSYSITIEAQYTSTGPTTVTVSFSNNGYSGSSSYSSKTYNVGSTYSDLPTFTPSSTSYRFDGWYTAASGGSKVTTSTAVSASQTTLYAHCSSLTTYHIYYDANGGQGAPSDTLFYSTGSVTLSSTKPTWTGGYKTFLGWSKSSTATSASYSAGGTISITSLANVTLYAVWQNKSVTVTYNPGYGSVSPTTQTKVVGDAYGSMPTPTRAGYGFTGWYTASGGTGDLVSSTTIVTNSSNHTLYAGWNQQFTITYDPNGGTGGPGSQTVSAIGVVVVPATKPTRQYCTFLGWGLSSTTTTVTYQSGDTIKGSSLSGNLTLWAVWQYTIVTVTLSANGGTFPSGKGSTEPTTKTFTRKVGVDTYGSELDTKPLRSGYYFMGWAISGSGSPIVASTLVTTSSNHTVQAVWIGDTSGYQLSYSSSSTGVGLPVMLMVGLAVTECGYLTVSNLPAHVSVASNSRVRLISAKQRENLGGTDLAKYVVLYNGYSRTLKNNTVTVSGNTVSVTSSGFSSEVGTNKSQTASFPYGELAFSMTSGTGMTSEPYGWILFRKMPWIKDGESINDYMSNMSPGTFKKGPVINLVSNENYEQTGNYVSIVLVPLLIDKSFLALLNPCGGQITSMSYFIRVYNGYAYGTLPTPVYSGYTFAGWYTAETGGSQVTASSVFYGNTDITLYAHWTGGSPTPGSSHTLYYEPNGGTVSPTYKTLTNGSAYGSLPTPTRSGYSFQGWFTEIYGGSSVSTTTTIGTDDVTIYAHWNTPKYTITFDPVGGSVSETTRSIDAGSPIQGLPNPWKKDNTFAGWYTASSGGTQVTDATVPTGSMTVYAHWNAGAHDMWVVVVS